MSQSCGWRCCSGGLEGPGRVPGDREPLLKSGTSQLSLRDCLLALSWERCQGAALRASEEVFCGYKPKIRYHYGLENTMVNPPPETIQQYSP